MGLNYCASSPVLTLPPQQLNPSNYFMHHQHQHHHETGNLNYAVAPDRSPPKKLAPKHPTPPSLNYLARPSNGVAGRKRSRADIGDDHDESAAAVQSLPNQMEPVMGPGMTLIYPNEPALNIAPDSQSGTWMEEKAAASQDEPPITRPRIIARKSQRRSVDESSNNSALAQPDPIVLRLGVGWKRTSEGQAAATAGCESYIRNQYPYVKQPKILLQHEGLNIVVARSDPIDQRGLLHQWWVFTEDLNSCRLLCNADEDEVFRRLAHKVQDERGNWISDILADGQIIHAKDSIKRVANAVQAEEVMEVDD